MTITSTPGPAAAPALAVTGAFEVPETLQLVAALVGGGVVILGGSIAAGRAVGRRRDLLAGPDLAVA